MHQEFKEDPRFKQCNRELWYTLALFVINVVIVGGTALAMGYNKPADEVTMVWGFPAWFFWGGLIGSLVFCILPVLMVKYLFKEMSIEAENDGEGDYE